MQANTPNPIHQPFLKSQCPRWSLLITCGSFVTLSPVSSWCRCSPVFPFITLTYYYFAYIACFYQPVLLQHFCLILGWMGQLCTKPNPIAADVDAPVLAELMLTEPSRLKKKSHIRPTLSALNVVILLSFTSFHGPWNKLVGTVNTEKLIFKECKEERSPGTKKKKKKRILMEKCIIEKSKAR